ncbi:unnamed protein product [marine sediment metagenome]|uniref:Uncharacterized protein n=1 Tax=marine sediment metagenome TaxID=412755 RepID=X1D670_9ZZZZ
MKDEQKVVLAEQKDVIKTFTLVHGGSKEPPHQKEWRILWCNVQHISGTNSELRVDTNQKEGLKTQLAYLFHKLAADATLMYVLTDMIGLRIIPSWGITFTGTLGIVDSYAVFQIVEKTFYPY